MIVWVLTTESGSVDARTIEIAGVFGSVAAVFKAVVDSVGRGHRPWSRAYVDDDDGALRFSTGPQPRDYHSRMARVQWRATHHLVES